MNLMEYAFPILCIMILLEVWIGLKQGKSHYTLTDSISGVSTGILFALAGVPTLFAALWVYEWVQNTISLPVLLGYAVYLPENPFSMGSSWVPQINWLALGAWAGVILVVDVIYYWFHRACHEIRFLWAMHVTHHSSEEFNLAVSFRGGSFQRIVEYLFYLPLAFLGVHWLFFISAHRLLKLYQFWVHTGAIGKLGFLEWFMVTPSNHRVHHGRQEQYLDKNHSGIFIIWDRLFGTFEPEGEEVHYGITAPTNNLNPVFLTFHEFTDLFSDMRKARSFKDAVRMLFKGPGWRPDYFEPGVAVATNRPKYDPKTPAPVMRYAIVQFLLNATAGILLWKAIHESLLNPFSTAILMAFMVYGLISVAGGVLERKPWAFASESTRNLLVLLIGILADMFGEHKIFDIFAPLIMIVGVASLYWIHSLQDYFPSLALVSDGEKNDSSGKIRLESKR